MSALFDLLQRVGDLKQLPRTGWLFAGIRQPESIADHSYATIWTALLLTEEINQDWQAEALTGPLDPATVMRIALVHDFAESILTDLPKRSTDLLGKATKYKAELQAMQALLKDIPNAAVYIDCWQSYAEGRTAEARLVRDADKLELLCQTLRYEATGQRNLQEFWEGHQWFYGASEKLWQSLQAQRNRQNSDNAINQP